MLVGWLIPIVFLALAGWFLFGPAPTNIPLDELASVDPADITTDPMRPPLPDPLVVRIAGFDKKCSECHSLFKPNRDQPLILTQHRDIVQGHGMNDRCFNCHHEVDPTKLVLPDGSNVTMDRSAELCATCHGPTYRDWEEGIHGRTVGSWDVHSPEHARLTCTQCHDPHAPAFDPMSALPGPQTLRMGDPEQRSHGGGHKKHNPLRQRVSEEAH